MLSSDVSSPLEGPFAHCIYGIVMENKPLFMALTTWIRVSKRIISLITTGDNWGIEHLVSGMHPQVHQATNNLRMRITISYWLYHCGTMLYHTVVSWNRATPSHHPFLDGIFRNKNKPAIGDPPWRAGNPHMLNTPGMMARPGAMKMGDASTRTAAELLSMSMDNQMALRKMTPWWRRRHGDGDVNGRKTPQYGTKKNIPDIRKDRNR